MLKLQKLVHNMLTLITNIVHNMNVDARGYKEYFVKISFFSILWECMRKPLISSWISHRHHCGNTVHPDCKFSEWMFCFALVCMYRMCLKNTNLPRVAMHVYCTSTSNIAHCHGITFLRSCHYFAFSALVQLNKD